MPRCVQIALLLLGSACLIQAQTGPALGDVARDTKKNKKEQAKLVLTDDVPPAPPPAIPDISSEGPDNSDQIIKAIETYRNSHNPQETEATIRNWYEKHDAMASAALNENRRIEQRERDRQLGYSVSDAHPRTQEESQEARQVDLISRREDLRHKQENALLSSHIQQSFIRARAWLASKNVKYEWFKIRCGNDYCSY